MQKSINTLDLHTNMLTQQRHGTLTYLTQTFCYMRYPVTSVTYQMPWKRKVQLFHGNRKGFCNKDEAEKHNFYNYEQSYF